MSDEKETQTMKKEDVQTAKKKGSIFGDPIIVIDNE